MLDILKILYCVPFLMYSCYSDIETRRVSDKVWLVMLSGAIFFIAYSISKFGISYLIRLFISAGLTYFFLEILSRLSTFFNIRMMGGADAKLLLVLAIIFPAYPAFQVIDNVFPLHAPMNFFSLSVLGDAVAIAIIIPVGFALYNLARNGFHVDNPAYIFLGYKTKISELTRKHIWIIQEFQEENGKIISRYKRGGIEVDDKSISKLKSLLKSGLIKDEVWVTPKLPFMIPLTIGFFVASSYGDLIFEFTKYFILR